MKTAIEIAADLDAEADRLEELVKTLRESARILRGKLKVAA